MKITTFLCLTLLHATAFAEEPSPNLACCTPAPPLPTPPPPLIAPTPGYTPPYIPPPSYHEEVQRQYGLMSAGLVIFTGAWTLTSIYGYVSNNGVFAVPILGPVIWAAQQNVDQSDVGGRMATMGLVVDTLVQAGGLAMAIVGAATKHKVKVRDRLTIAPSASPQGASVALSSRF
jgi:hypothetical protein